jgi:hypothetical protein
MASNDERRKGVRVALPAEFYFNILHSDAEYSRGQFSVFRRLAAIDAVQVPPFRTEAQILLSRIDQKLSILIGLLAERSSQKNYSYYGIAADISEFGLSFGHNHTFPKGATIEVGLQLSKGDSRLMDIAGRIVRAMPSPEPDATFAMSYGVEFTDIQGVDQNEIVQWIFSNQREQIRRRREQKP